MATDNEEIAALLLLLKLKLEEQFKPKLDRFFSQISKEIAIVWTVTRNLPSLNSFEPELISMLRSYYRKVAITFQGELADRIVDSKLKAAIDEDSKIALNTVRYINQHSEVQAKIILDTTKRDLQEIASKNIIQMAASGELTTDYQLGKAIQKSFEQSIDARKETIAITETQISSEYLRYIETQGIMQLASEAQVPIVFQKTWGAILDNKTRKSHVLADGQSRNINSPYNVGNELMLIPGDTSLGASLENIINCRCSSVVTIQA